MSTKPSLYEGPFTFTCLQPSQEKCGAELLIDFPLTVVRSCFTHTHTHTHKSAQALSLQKTLFGILSLPWIHSESLWVLRSVSVGIGYPPEPHAGTH